MDSGVIVLLCELVAFMVCAMELIRSLVSLRREQLRKQRREERATNKRKKGV